MLTTWTSLLSPWLRAMSLPGWLLLVESMCECALLLLRWFPVHRAAAASSCYVTVNAHMPGPTIVMSQADPCTQLASRLTSVVQARQKSSAVFFTFVVSANFITDVEGTPSVHSPSEATLFE